MATQVSVIIPTYNHRDFVTETLESVFAQRFKEYEVIVVNDGSPDDTAQLLRPLAMTGRIRYIEQPNAGQAAARNRGLAQARGEFVAFLDDDDLWPAEKLQWQVGFLRANPSIGLAGGTSVKLGFPIPALDGSAAYPSFESLFGGNPFRSPGQWLGRTSLIRELGGFDTRIWGADDFELLFHVCRRSRICKLNRLALLYRIHGSNASGDSERMFVNLRRVLDRHIPEVNQAARGYQRRVAQRSLYRYSGAKMMARLRGEMAELNLNAALMTTRHLAAFGKTIVSDPSLRHMIFRDILPRPLISLAKSLRDRVRRAGSVTP